MQTLKNYKEEGGEEGEKAVAAAAAAAAGAVAADADPPASFVVNADGGKEELS